MQYKVVLIEGFSLLLHRVFNRKFYLKIIKYSSIYTIDNKSERNQNILIHVLESLIVINKKAKSVNQCFFKSLKEFCKVSSSRLLLYTCGYLVLAKISNLSKLSHDSSNYILLQRM